MKFLGATELTAFLERHPGQAGALRAWVSEIRHRTWTSVESLTANFRLAAGRSPEIVFHVGDPPTAIATLIDFRNGVLLVTLIEPASGLSTLTGTGTLIKHD